MRVITIISAFILFSFCSSFTESENTFVYGADSLGLPKIDKNDEIIKRQAYTISYSEKHELAEWAAYTLKGNDVNKRPVKALFSFRNDPKVRSSSASNKDYKRSGFDRGHLIPAGDMSWSYRLKKDTYYYSNAAPQQPQFNQGIWKELEAHIRISAQKNKKLYIVVGPVLNDSLPTIGPNKVAVPKYFYKVILDYSEPAVKCVGFLLPNKKTNKSLSEFVVSVDEVEELTGLDFFHRLPDDIEEKLESKSELKRWGL